MLTERQTPTTCPGCGAPWEMPCSYCGARRAIASLLRVPTVPAREAYALMGARTLEARRYATLPSQWSPVLGDFALMDDGRLEVAR